MLRTTRGDVDRSLSIALLSLQAQPESYLDDSGLRALEPPLVERGHRATILTHLRGSLPEGDWLTALGALLRGGAYDVIIVERAWSAPLIDLLRSALPQDGRLLRLGRGAASPFDHRFDATLSHDGVLDYVDGVEHPRTASWRVTRDELKALRVRPTRAEETRPSAPGRALVELSGGDGRPTLSGPAVGCPFLLDARTSPAFADTALDPAHTQTKGCSFCLDNVGAYAAFSEEEVVGAWLRGLRHIRAARPEAREVLLTDERPHPYLPAFFRALLAEPGLAPLELLIKTRVDWLLEFADGALTEALTLAAQGGHVLHIYLVGFESFDQEHLDLYNKGVTVADNFAAAARLRELGRQFPQSLEFRRLRAHGIILFSPWTRPEALVENARQMRAIGFAEFRSQALRTRLRLYAHVPLHAKAAADHLLVEDFEAGRPDRAAEQGYDASLPWRFLDPRTEAVFRAANRLAEREPALAEADVLELVARFVIRHPGLADVPDAAVLPIIVALRTWGPSLAEVVHALGPTLAGCDREVDGVLAGDKPGCLKEGVPAADAEALACAYRAMGLASAIVSRHDLDLASGLHDPAHATGAYAIVAVARDEATLSAVLERQRGVEQHDDEAVTSMGALMGFPTCCTEAFRARRARGDNLALERAPFREHPDARLLVENHRLGPFTLISHLLCNPECQASAATASRVLDRLHGEDADATERALEHLAAPVLFCDYARRARLRGRWAGAEFLVDELTAPPGTHLGVSIEGVASITLAPAGVRLRYRDGSEQKLRVAYPILVEPGRALAPAARAALALDPRIDAETRSASHGVGEAQPLAGGPPSEGEALPPMPAGVTPGRRFGDLQILKVRSTPTAHEVMLAGGGQRLVLRLRAWTQASRAAIRRGRWAIEVLGAPDPERLPERLRAAVGAFARSLPAAPPTTAAAPSASVPAASARPRGAAAPVLCTAPWTTLEIVDPDGGIRQCCNDWTIGARGNISEGSLLSVWNGPGYLHARRIMAGTSPAPLCHDICPRLYDRKFGGERFEIHSGADVYVRNQLLMAEEIAERREEVRSRPLYVAICPSTYCNYDCIMCVHGRSPRRELPERIWDELPELLPTLRVLTLLGGEPLANPLAMRFLRQYDRARYPDASVSLVTNGSLLGEQTLKHLGRCSFGHVTVSLNAGTASVYESVQRGVSLEEVLRNVDSLRRFRDQQARRFDIVLSFVVQPANAHTLVEFGELARARDLTVRLLPLSPHGPDGLDYYADADAVARVLEHLDRFARWAEAAQPGFLPEIAATREAIRLEAGARASAPGTRRLPIIGR